MILGHRVGNGLGLFSKIIGEIKENLLGTDFRVYESGIMNEFIRISSLGQKEERNREDITVLRESCIDC